MTTSHPSRPTALDSIISVHVPDAAKMSHAAFRQHYLVSDIAQWRLGILVMAIANLAFLWFDYRLYGFSQLFYLYVGVRLIMTVYSIWAWIYLTPNKPIDRLDTVMLIWGYMGIAIILLAAIGRPTQYYGHYVFEVFGIMMFFTAMSLPPKNQLTAALVYLCIALPLLLFYKTPPLPIYTSNVAFVLILGVISGYLISVRIQRYRMAAFIANQELENQARTDILTSLANRRAFMEWATTQVKHSRERGHALSLLMMDIDHFKAINDQFGHAGGDQLLIAFAQRIHRTIEPHEYFARLGGEEFVMGIPYAHIDKARDRAEQLLAQVSATPFGMMPHQTMPVTMSIGVATTDAAEIDIEPALKRADSALYTAKNAGRNRVEVSALTDTHQ